MGLGRRGFKKAKPAEEFAMELWEKETELPPSRTKSLIFCAGEAGGGGLYYKAKRD